jgi:hypothetical protein
LLNPDFRDMLSALSEAAVDYLVVGAYAMAAHDAATVQQGSGVIKLSWAHASSDRTQ